MNCLNCEAPLQGNFCMNCGQKADVHPINLKTVMHDFFHAFTHTDKGFLLTIKELLRRPGIVAKEYLQGKRKKYFNPLSFLVITMALSAYLSLKTGYFEAFSSPRRQSTGQQQINKPAPQQKPFDITKLSKFNQVKFGAYRIIIDDGKILGLVLITPLFSILSWVFFRKPRHGIAEHFVLQSYLFGLSNVFRVVIFIPLFLISGRVQVVDSIFQAVLLVYMIIAFRQFFMNRLFPTILKSILILFLFIALFWCLIWGYVYVKLFLQELFI